jgi:ATP adenylyltransferase
VTRPGSSRRGAAMPMQSAPLQPGTLWPAITRATHQALLSGALLPIETEQEEIEDGGMRFLVRRVSSLARKAEIHTQLQQARPADPFLPYDPMLFVADVSHTHLALLNKFPVLDHHVLIVTRTFAPQETLLDTGDFAALAACMAEFEALGFYNGGREAGASQDHKHLQLVPLSLAPGRTGLPIEPLLRHARRSGGVGSVAGLPFRHACADLATQMWARRELTGEFLGGVYHDLCHAAGIEEREVRGERRQSGPYNLLLTREWMLLVPRSREHYASISVNALGFAGSLLVKDNAQLECVRNKRPMGVLKEVTFPA